VALSRATGAHVMEGGVLRYSGTAAELESRPERLQSAYLLRGSPIKPGDALGAAALDGPCLTVVRQPSTAPCLTVPGPAAPARTQPLRAAPYPMPRAGKVTKRINPPGERGAEYHLPGSFWTRASPAAGEEGRR
jgi:hypothetical protein